MQGDLRGLSAVLARLACCGSIPRLGPIHTTHIQIGVATNLTSACREEGRKAATEWLKGAIDAPDPYALMAGAAELRAPVAIKAGVVSEEDFAELPADGWLEMAGVHVHAGVREVITEAYWDRVGPMGCSQTLQGMFDELA